jgi:hypothetical protein
MRRSSLLCALLLSSVAACAPATAKVFFRIGSSPLPAPGKTGIRNLVLVWPLRDSLIVAQFRSQGYRVWLQCDSKDLAQTVTVADRIAVEGLIITNSASLKQAPDKEISSLAAVHKKLAFRILVSGGKQPQMKGRLVVERDGVLQVSSPSTQPWLDTNLATVRLAPDPDPVYDFSWSTSDVSPGAWHPDAEDYALAIAESDAIRSDVIIDLPVSLQDALNSGDPQAWSLWKNVIPYLSFSSRVSAHGKQLVASIGVIVDDARANYEAINLMARHNLPFEAVRTADLTPARLNRWNSVVVFSPLNKDSAAMLRDFAEKGGIVVFVDPHDRFPWHSAPPLRKESHSTTYKIGSGQIVELGEPVIDPENFARDLRRLIGPERPSLALWNSLTTLVAAYREQSHSAVTLYLVNYADQPDNVQVQVKGHFRRVRLESPDEPCCVSLPSVERGGFTEFTVPSLRIAARVHLDFDAESSAAQ